MSKMFRRAAFAALAAAALALAACQGGQAGPTASSTAATSTAADASWDYIAQKGEIVIGLDDTFAPMGFRDEKNQLVGFDIDLAKEVAKRLNVKATFQPIDWDAKEMELSGKKIDVIWNGLSITPERQKAMSFTKPYLDNKIVLMVKKGVALADRAQLAKMKIGTQAKSSALEVLQKDEVWAKVKDKVSEYKSYDEALLDLKIGRVDVIVVDEVLGLYKNAKMGNAFDIAPLDFGSDVYGIGFRLGEAAFVAKVEEALDAMKADGSAAAISTTWFGKDIIVK